jgi:hypothetical protein
VRREQLILELSLRLGVPKHSAQVFLHAFFDSAKAALRTGDPLRLGGIGTWTPTIHADGTLNSIDFVPSAGTFAGDDVPASGPHSSIDTIHFIPAEALEADASSTAATMIDVAELVEEVQSQFRSSNGQGNREASAIPLPPPPPDDEIPGDEEFSYEEDDGFADNGMEGDEEIAYENEEYVHDQGIDTELTEEQERSGENADDEEIEDDEGNKEIEDDEEAEQDPDDDEVFYRNRDQLYNPPEERSSRRLLLIALTLTVIVVTILLFMFFGKEERPAVPGHSTGYGLTDGLPAIAVAPFLNFD